MKKIIIISLVILVTLFMIGCIEQESNINNIDLNVNLFSDFNYDSKESTNFPEPTLNVDSNISVDDSLKMQAIKEKNPDLCKNILSEEIKDNCFLNVSIILKDSSVCENIDSNVAKSNCVLSVRRRN